MVTVGSYNAFKEISLVYLITLGNVEILRPKCLGAVQGRH